jgi:outer membrane protein assembly factor BamA
MVLDRNIHRTGILLGLVLCLPHLQLLAQDNTPVRVQGVVVTGNRTTVERVILREMTVQEGDTLDRDALYEKLERSRLNLMNTALFNSVLVMPLYLGPGEVVVEVTVNERWYIWPTPILEIADPNFNTWLTFRDLRRLNYGAYMYHYNFRGRNETLYIQAQFGYTRQFGLFYRAPFVDKAQRWGVSLGGSYRQQNEITLGTVDNVRVLHAAPDGSARDEVQGRMEVSLRKAYYLKHIWRIGYDQATLLDTVTPDYFARGAANTRFLTLGYSLIWDKRDLRMYPRSGHLTELRLDRYGLGMLDENAPDITTVVGTVKKWWRTSDRITLAMSMRGKATIGTPPYHVQEGLGYRHYVRGYEYYVIDGQHNVLGRANAILQLVKPREYRLEAVPMEAFRTLYFALYLNAYVDAGHVWDDLYGAMNPLGNNWLGGYGLGLDLVTSYDQVLRGEYSVNLLGEHGFFLHFTQPF